MVSDSVLLPALHMYAPAHVSLLLFHHPIHPEKYLRQICSEKNTQFHRYLIQFPHITISNTPTITGIVTIDSSVVNTYSELEYAASLS